MVNFWESNVKPLNFQEQLGKPTAVYTTKMSYTGYIQSVIGLILFIIGLLSVELRFLVIFGVFPLLHFTGTRFRFIAFFSKGLVIKERFSHKVVFFDDIIAYKIVKLNKLWYLLLRNNAFNKSIDLKTIDGTISIGSSGRILKSHTYPRFPKGYDLVDFEGMARLLEKEVPSK